MTKLIRPLTLQGSCLSFSNQDHSQVSSNLAEEGDVMPTLVLLMFREAESRRLGVPSNLS